MKNRKTIASLVIAILTAGSAFAQDADTRWPFRPTRQRSLAARWN